MSHTLALSSFPQYPSYLSSHSSEPGVLFNDPLASLNSLRSLERFTHEHRTALVKGLAHDLVTWNAPQQAHDALLLLHQPNTYAVVTGQEAGVFGGPLYTLIKAMGAVRVAEQLSAQFPDHHFVPMFWIEGDDHDFNEARSVVVLNAKGESCAFGYDDGDARPLPVGDRHVSNTGIETLTEQLRDVLPTSEFGEEALLLLNGCYASGTLTDGFARTLYRLMGETPLVLVSSRNPAVKQAAADVFASEAAHPEALYNAVVTRTEQMVAKGVVGSIKPKQGALFIVRNGERRALDYRDGAYAIRGTDEVLSTEEAADLARLHPEQFSPNVALRPMVQDAALPTALYVSGPAELAYMNQLRSAYAEFGLQPPAIASRPFAMLLEPKVRRVLETTGISLEELCASDFNAAERVLDEAMVNELESATSQASTQITAGFAAMADLTTRIDPTLVKTLGAHTASAEKSLHELSKRLLSSLKKKQQTEIDRLEGARRMVLPDGKLQERTLNAIYFLSKYGMEALRGALGKIVIAEGALQVIGMRDEG